MKLSGKNIAKKVNFFAIIAIVVAIAVVLNVIMELLPLDLDTTTESIFTLTDTTKEVLEGLEEKVTVYALYDKVEGESDTGNGGTADVIRILDIYDRDENVEVQYIDLDKNPKFLLNTVGESQASNYDEGDYLVCTYDSDENVKNVRRIDGDDMFATYEQTYNYFYTYEIVTGVQVEQKLTSALIKVTSEVPVIYYSTGFGEASISNYSTITEYMEDSGYDFKSIDLRTEDFEDNGVAVMFFGPTEDLTDAVYDKLERWLNAGHSAFFFMDIKGLDTEKYIYDEFTSFNKLFANYGIEAETTYVEECDEYAMDTGNDDILFKTTTKSVSALEDLESTEFYVYNTRSFIVDNNVDNCETESFLVTSKEATKNYLLTDTAAWTGASNIGVGSKLEYGINTSHIVTLGSSWSFSDVCLSFTGSDAAKSIINECMSWMELEPSLNVGDSILAKTYNNGVTSYTDVSDKALEVINIITMIAIPAVIVLAGIIMWLRRRHL